MIGPTEDDATIYRGMSGTVSSEELKAMQLVLTAWASALDRLPPEAATVRIVFLACVQSIETMGPAYCRLAALNLMRMADQQ